MNTPRLSADARREQILDVAIDVFGRSGYFGASMNDIAEAAGVTKPVLYQHFDSKSDLYSALLDEVGARMLDAIAKATADATDGKQQTERGFQAYFRWVAHRHDEFMLLFGGSARHDGEFSAQIRRITDDAAAAIAPLISVDIDARAPHHARARARRAGRGREPPARRARRVVRCRRDRPRGQRPGLGRPAGDQPRHLSGPRPAGRPRRRGTPAAQSSRSDVRQLLKVGRSAADLVGDAETTPRPRCDRRNGCAPPGRAGVGVHRRRPGGSDVRHRRRRTARRRGRARVALGPGRRRCHRPIWPPCKLNSARSTAKDRPPWSNSRASASNSHLRSRPPSNVSRERTHRCVIGAGGAPARRLRRRHRRPAAHRGHTVGCRTGR